MKTIISILFLIGFFPPVLSAEIIQKDCILDRKTADGITKSLSLPITILMTYNPGTKTYSEDAVILNPVEIYHAFLSYDNGVFILKNKTSSIYEYDDFILNEKILTRKNQYKTYDKNGSVFTGTCD